VLWPLQVERFANASGLSQRPVPNPYRVHGHANGNHHDERFHPPNILTVLATLSRCSLEQSPLVLPHLKGGFSTHPIKFAAVRTAVRVRRGGKGVRRGGVGHHPI
jgi:hypothetical protein